MSPDHLFHYLPIHVTWQAMSLSMLLSFVFTALVAKVYAVTYQGLSWSPSLVQSFMLTSLIACMLMLAIGDNLAGAIGSMGFLALIRFRTNLRDPRDMAYTFASLGIGVAAGLQAYLTTAIGAISFCLVAVLLHVSGAGTRRMHDGLLRFQAEAGSEAPDLAANALLFHTKHFVLVTMRDVAQGTMHDYSYQVRLVAPGGDAQALLRALGLIEGLHGIAYMNQQSTVEV